MFKRVTGSLAILNDGLFRKSAGAGTNTISVTFTNTGTVESRSGTIRFTGELFLASECSLSFVPGGRRVGLDYGQVSVSGNLGLDGTLKVSLTNGFAPLVGEVFQVLNFGSRSGGFRRDEGLGLNGDPFLQVLSGNQNLSLIARSVLGTPPAPATNLVNQSVAVGGAITFRIEPMGTEPFSYEWRFNGNTIAGTTNSTLIIANAQTASSGIYSVVVTDGLGQIETYTATLTVLLPPTVTV
jgi:hypothetical protein